MSSQSPFLKSGVTRLTFRDDGTPDDNEKLNKYVKYLEKNRNASFQIPNIDSIYSPVALLLSILKW